MSNKNYHLYQVVGRKAPYTIGDKDVPNPPAFRIKIFARDELQAKSRFWYFMHQMRKMKKTTGEILDVNEVSIAVDYIHWVFLNTYFQRYIVVSAKFTIWSWIFVNFL